MWSVTTRPSTASPRNSSRSFDASPGDSATQDRWARARCSSSGSANWCASRSARASDAACSLRSGGTHAGDDVVDRVPHGLEVLEVLVLDAKADRSLTDFLLDRFHELDEGERVGFEVVGERLTFGDGARVDLEDVGEAVADQLEDLLAVHRALLHVGLGRHAPDGSRFTSGQADR